MKSNVIASCMIVLEADLSRPKGFNTVYTA